ncbi:serine/threonine-protein phosphatase 6 regulatory ankyrin repeat subunit B-like [Haliotis asinina]|uniref:serine/threonine-protein phosphatase 6 regulatory ankyrin repeat subunit B-like n=1 Tax=Haliotis asinina TaxID=109174 RepID=UPI00353189AA
MEILGGTDRRFPNMCDSTNELINYDATPYVSTYYERSALRLLADHGRIFIKGRSGSGKSRLGLRLLSKLSENNTRVPVLLTSAEEWKLIPKTTGRDRRKYIVMIDNIFGSSNLVSSKVGEWEKTFNIMWPSIESEHIFLIMTSRPEISVQCENELKNYNLMKHIPCVSLDEGEYTLRQSEKKRMLQTICPIKSGFTLEEMRVIAESRAPLGFPQCCKFFASSKQAQSKGVSFFLRPHEYVLEEVNILQESDGLGYFVLLLILIQNGCIKHTLLKKRTPEFSHIVETLKDVCANIPENPRLVGIREKAHSLCGVYLKRTQDGYEFQHQSISECVFISLSKIDTNLCIKICPVQLLLELVQTKGNYPNVNEMVILLTEDHHPTFADRITTLLLDPTHSKEILNHAAFNDENFIQCLISKWRSEDKIQIIWQHQFERKTHLCFTGQGYKVPLFGFGRIVPCLIFKNNKRLVDILIAMNRDTCTHVLQECLPCAVYVGRNDLVKTLLDYGATPDEPCFRALCPARQIDTDVTQTIFNVVVAEHRRFTWDSISNLVDLFWLAVMNGNVHIVQLLVERLKSDTDSLKTFRYALLGLVKELSTGHRCPLFKPHDMRHLSEIVRILLDTGCKVDFDYLTLQAASHADATVLRLVLAQSVHVKDIYLKNEDIYSNEDYYPTPLQQAAAYGGGDCLEEILRCTQVGQVKIDMDQERKLINSNAFLLHTAVQHGNIECASLLLEKGTEVNTQDRNGNTPLHVAVRHNQMTSIELLLSKHASVDMKNSNGCIPLLCMEHASLPDLNSIIRLIKAGSDVNEVDTQQRTLLYKAAESGHFAIVKYLCNKGANVNIDTQHLNIPHMTITEERKLCKRVILVACRNADIDVVKLLCEHGADVDVADDNGETVMHKAAASPIDAVEKLQYLLDTKQVPLSNKDHFERTASFPAVMSALQTGYLEVLHFLSSRKMDFKQTDKFGNSLLLHAFVLSSSKNAVSDGFIKLMLHHGIDPNLKNLQGRTVLHYATVKGDKNKLALLLEGGADPRISDDKGRTVLHRAVKKQHFDNVRLFLEKGANPDVQDKNGKTALLLAGELKDSETMKLLLNKGADPSVSDNYGRDALHYAVTSQDCVIMKLLLLNGASPCTQDKFGTTAIHIAAKRLDIENVMLLLEHGANPHTRDQHCQTTLHFAARNANSEVLRLFLERGVDASVQDNTGMTALHCAVLWCHTENVELLLERCQERDKQDKNGKTPLHHASETEFSNIVKLLLDGNFDPCVQNHNDETPLHCAAKHGHNGNVRLLLSKGANGSLKDKHGKTALHYTSTLNKDSMEQLLAHGADSNAKDESGRTPLHLATEENYDMVKLLLDNGADPCVKDDEGKTPLHLAAVHKLESIHLLLEKGADPLIKDKEGRTPLHYAAEHNDWGCANQLLENGGDPCIQDQQGKTALHDAVKADYDRNVYRRTGTSYKYLSSRIKKKSIAKLLVDKGCSKSVTDNEGKTALHYAAESSSGDSLQLLLDDTAITSIKDKHGKTPLHYAAAKGSSDSVKLLLEKGADPCTNDLQGKTPLHCAAETEHGDNIRYLLDNGADANQQDNEGRTPLHYAAASDCSLSVRLLLNKGCVTALSDQLGKTALHCAAGGSCSDNVRLLLENGADPLVKDQQGMTAFDYATRGGNTVIVRLLQGSAAQN